MTNQPIQFKPGVPPKDGLYFVYLNKVKDHDINKFEKGKWMNNHSLITHYAEIPR